MLRTPSVAAEKREHKLSKYTLGADFYPCKCCVLCKDASNSNIEELQIKDISLPPLKPSLHCRISFRGYGFQPFHNECAEIRDYSVATFQWRHSVGKGIRNVCRAKGLKDTMQHLKDRSTDDRRKM